MEAGITFADTWHTNKDWGLRLISVYIPMPEPKISLVELPGADGSLDLTEINGRTQYYDRSGLEFVFDFADGDYTRWLMKYSEVAKALHGQKIKTILDEEPDCYYYARLMVDSVKSNPVLSQITLSGTADPYKCDITSSAEEWLWDPFNFNTGVIRVLKDIEISASNKTVTILGAGVSVAPIFEVSASNNLIVAYGGKTYKLSTGRNRFPEIRVGGTDVTLNFTGTGKLTVDYRGRYL